MDSLLKLALAGTARGAGAPPPPATPADALVAPGADHTAERRVLLIAGARAVYRRAGVSPRTIAAPPIVAPDDATPACSPGAARLFAAILAGEQGELLPEALERLRLAGRRLPHDLLPAALEAGSRKSDLRPALLATLGERGRWLAAHNQPWRWATARPLADDGALPDDAEALWAEGLPAQRLAILRRVRAHDPAQGRAWLAAAWQGEKAEFRAEAIRALDTGLSLDDEPFLETALDDRSQAVRAEAATLLARLPGAALTMRLRERTDHFLAFVPGLLAGGWRAAAKALVKGAAGGKLTVTPPATYDQAWARDGIAEKPPQGTGARAWWLQQFLALLPPSHWSGRFGVEPATLISAVEGGDWATAVLDGWQRAALRYRDEAWSAALWQYWSGAKLDRMRQHEIGRLMGELAGCLPKAQAEPLVLDALARANGLDDRLIATLQSLPRPWSVAFGNTILRQLRDRVRDLSQRGSAAYYSEPWLGLVTDVALTLPQSCFGEALAIQAIADKDANPATVGWWQRRISEFGDLIRTRQRLMEELPL